MRRSRNPSWGQEWAKAPLIAMRSGNNSSGPMHQEPPQRGARASQGRCPHEQVDMRPGAAITEGLLGLAEPSHPGSLQGRGEEVLVKRQEGQETATLSCPEGRSALESKPGHRGLTLRGARVGGLWGPCFKLRALPVAQAGKEPAGNAGDLGSGPGLG